LISTYADNYRNNHPETAQRHYVEIPLTGDNPVAVASGRVGRATLLNGIVDQAAAGRTALLERRLPDPASAGIG